MRLNTRRCKPATEYLLRTSLTLIRGHSLIRFLTVKRAGVIESETSIRELRSDPCPTLVHSQSHILGCILLLCQLSDVVSFIIFDLLDQIILHPEYL